MKQDSPCFVWDLTIPADAITVDELKIRFKEDCKKWAFQTEKGNETGYVHYQCRISLKEKIRFGPMVELYKDLKAHISKTSAENSTNLFYVMKRDTRIEGPFTDTDPYIPKQWRNPPAQWYPWQKKILNVIESEPDLRKIYVVVDTVGNSGKSTLCGYLSARGTIRKIPPLNDFKDVMRMVCDVPDSSAYFIDIPRALDKSKLKNFYGAVEEIKNGYAFDDRYHFKEKHFDTPHIVVFTNCEPDYNLLTADRWVKIDIEK